MSVKPKSQQPTYAGIVVTGDTRELAVQAYTNVATGKNFEVLASADNSFMLATTAGAAKFYNPLSDDKEKMNKVDRELEVSASDQGSEKLVSVAYTVCGECDSHIVADDAESVANCPSCHSSVDFSLDFEDDLESESESIEDDLSGDQGFVVVASSAEEAANQLKGLLQDPSNAVAFTSESGVSFVSHADSDVSCDPFNGDTVEGEELDAQASADLEANAASMDPVAHYFQCFNDECGSHIISQSADTIYCPSCESAVMDPEDLVELEQHMAELESDSMSDDMDDDDMDDDDDDLMDDDDELEDDEDEDDDDLESDSDADFDELDEEFETISSSDDELDDDLELESDSGDDSDGEADEDDDDSDEEDDSDDDDDEIDGLDDEEDEEDDSDMESDSTVAEVSEIDAMTLVANTTEGGLQADQVSLVNCSSVAGQARWIAFHGDNVIAMASESGVDGAAKQIFQTPNFATAVMQAVANDGVQQGLEQFGFKAIAFDSDKLQVAVSNQIVNEANAKIETFEQAQADRDGKLMERIGQALATSMMGINRGVFAGKSNPIITALASQLTAAGVANAQDLVDSAFEAQADSFNKLVLDQTLELVSKPNETQEDLAKMVASSSYARKGNHTESVSASVEQRLTPRTVTNKTPVVELQSKSSNGNFDQRASALVNKMFSS